MFLPLISGSKNFQVLSSLNTKSFLSIPSFKHVETPGVLQTSKEMTWLCHCLAFTETPREPCRLMAVPELHQGLGNQSGWDLGRICLLKEYTLQGINISHLGKRNIIFKMPFWGDMLVPWRVYQILFCVCFE